MIPEKFIPDETVTVGEPPVPTTEVQCTCGAVVEGGDPFIEHCETTAGKHEIHKGWLK